MVIVWRPASETEKNTRSSEFPLTSKADTGRITIAAAIRARRSAGRGHFIIFIPEDVIIQMLKYILDGVVSIQTSCDSLLAHWE